MGVGHDQGVGTGGGVGAGVGAGVVGSGSAAHMCSLPEVSARPQRHNG